MTLPASTWPASTRPALSTPAAEPRVIAVAVTSHGFGHAARACAVIEALQGRQENLRFEIFTTVPPWFFLDNLRGAITIHPTLVDLGLVQHDALSIDLARSIAELDHFQAQSDELARHLAERFAAHGVDLVIADIAPIALLAARQANLPSVLVENFTWDWIYQGLAAQEPAFLAHATRMHRCFRQARLRCQAAPFCAPAEDPADDSSPAQPSTRVVRTATVARRARAKPAETRTELGIPESAVALLVTMGGIPWRHPGSDAARAPQESAVTDSAPPHDVSDQDDPWLVLPSDVAEIRAVGKQIFLPHRSRFYHPDLVAAVDGVVAKLGYSTLAEAAACGRPLAYVARPDFPESDKLESWAKANLLTHRIEPEVFTTGRWYPTLRPWIACFDPRPPATVDDDAPAETAPVPAHGADQIAEEILALLSRPPV